MVVLQAYVMTVCLFFKVLYSFVPSICFPIIKSQMLKCCCYQLICKEMLKPQPNSMKPKSLLNPIQTLVSLIYHAQTLNTIAHSKHM